MEIGDVHFETWWNALSQECRDNILQLIPTMGSDQRTIFSGRRWHELHGWLRVEVRSMHDIMKPA